MTGRQVERVLVRLASPGAQLVPLRDGRYGVLANGDRRRRPVARLDREAVQRLEASGALIKCADGALGLSEAGRARMRRDAASEDEAFQAQHAALVDRSVIDGDGAVRTVRGFDAHAPLKGLAALRDGRGAVWLNSAELAAAARLRSDWRAAQIGLLRGSDWRAPPKGSTARGSGADSAMAARCDARRNLEERLRALAPPLRRVVERVCLQEGGAGSAGARRGLAASLRQARSEAWLSAIGHALSGRPRLLLNA